MANIDPYTIKLQQAVVQKFNRSNIPHYVIMVDMMHGAAIDYFWCLNGVPVKTHANKPIKQEFDIDTVLFLDIDCVPLHERAIDYYLNLAAVDRGGVVGNAQRSNHLDNGQHMFAAPSSLAISRESFKYIGAPSALETHRSDVAEEYTWAAEATTDSMVDLFMPVSFDRKPVTTDAPHWPLADGHPVYGGGTTYGDEESLLFYHNFEIRIPGQQELFRKKCLEILGE